MRELKCPKCGSVFSVDEADYASIVNQVKNAEFAIEVNRRLQELHQQHLAEQQTAEAKLEKNYLMELGKKDQDLNRKELEIAQLKKDLHEMMEATVDEMIDNYKADNVPFHTYYMTVSGHCNYNWGGNAMSSKHKEEAKEAFPDASQSVQAYMACNKELDLAMEYLLKKLEEAGIADDTVIVLGADHYPYAMSEGNEEDYYIELSGIEDTPKSISRYQSTLIMYCSSMEEPIYVDTPCSSIDIVPTIANLFGIEYDSRLYSGRDIFATNYTHGEVSSTIPLVIIPIGNRYSFITDAGSYDAVTKEFTANTEIEDEKQYINDVQNIISNKWKYAKLMITNNYYSKVFPDGLE